MPAAQTHVFIAHLVLDRIRRGVPDGHGNVRVFLPAIPAEAPHGLPHPVPHLPRPGRPIPPIDLRFPRPGQPFPRPEPPAPAVVPRQPISVMIPAGTAAILLTRPASFSFGAASPDFLPDVISGITTSHQPKSREKTLADFMKTFGNTVRWTDNGEVAWFLGWFCHLCADVFGHHWVGVQAKGDFLSWLSTPPDVVRLHLGIEMEWAKSIGERTGKVDFLRNEVFFEFGPTCTSPDDAAIGELFFRRSLVLDAMLTDGAPLCDRFYKIDEAKDPANEVVQLVDPLIRVRDWRGWHVEQKKKAEKAKMLNDSPLGRMADIPLPRVSPEKLAQMRLPCPLCEAHGQVTQMVERACPVCLGIGVIEEKVRGVCILCNGGGKQRVDCSACEGLPDPLREVCPECHGERKVENVCLLCLGAKAGAEEARKICPTCKGARNVREDLDAKCPFCAGQKFLEKALGDPGFSSRDLVDTVLRRIIHFHKARVERIDRLLGLYLDAGERLAMLLLTPEPDMADGSKVQGCFQAFLDELGDFCASTLTLSDLAPELQAYDDAVRKGVEDLLALALKLLEFLPVNLPEIYARLKKEIVKAAVDELAKRFQSLLTDSERAMLGKDALEKYLPESFPPIADAVSLFLLALEGALPTMAGLGKAFETLGDANNIDGHGQPTMVAPFEDAAFWNARFRLVKNGEKGEEETIRLQF
jgi:hypothetical protein